MSKRKPDVEAFHRDYPFATYQWGEQEERNLWKYDPELVARARAAAVIRITQRRMAAPIANAIGAILNALTPKETR